MFTIRYDPDLPSSVLAEAFFPGDPQDRWAVRISHLALQPGTGGFLDNIVNILAHEFMHILGMRHWDAGGAELLEPSMHWPGTKDNDRKSIMDTGGHPRHLWFGPDDFRALRQLYAAPKGACINGLTVVDVGPVRHPDANVSAGSKHTNWPGPEGTASLGRDNMGNACLNNVLCWSCLLFVGFVYFLYMDCFSMHQRS